MPIGRPTFQIDPARLRGLREEAALTQTQLAERAYKHLKKSGGSPKTNYQKIERTGKTSVAMAQAFADVLNTTVDVLRGGAPEAPDPVATLDRLKNQLREQLKAGNNAALHMALDQTDLSDTDPVHNFAVDLLCRIEAAQLGQQHDEMQRLADLTGWSCKQLMQSASFDGHWLLVSTEYGARQSEIISGAVELRYRIEEAAAKFVNTGESDAVITLRESLPWLHVELTTPRHRRMRCVFSFVRCKALVTGLKWVKPTWRDRFSLDDQLRSWAYSTANFVVGFDGERWPKDVRRLRVLLQEFGADCDQPTRVATIKGNLDELPDDVFENFQVDGSSHALAVNLISSAIWPELTKRLKDWPKSCWTIRSGEGIGFELNTPLKLAIERGEKHYFGIKFRLLLVEETEPEKLIFVPWRKVCVAKLAGELQAQFDEEVWDDPRAVGCGTAPVGSLAT